jgi:hypothetical protein
MATEIQNRMLSLEEMSECGWNEFYIDDVEVIKFSDYIQLLNENGVPISNGKIADGVIIIENRCPVFNRSRYHWKYNGN